MNWQDYAYDVAKAEQLYSQFVSQGAVAFLGWGTGDSEALRARVTSDKIPFMSGSYSEGLADPKKTPYNFVVAPTYSKQMEVALDLIKKEGGTGVAAFYNDSPFGKSPLKAGETKAGALGLEFSSYAMPKGATSYDAQLTTAKGATDIVVQNVSSPAALLAKNVKAQGLHDASHLSQLVYRRAVRVAGRSCRRGHQGRGSLRSADSAGGRHERPGGLSAVQG